MSHTGDVIFTSGHIHVIYLGLKYGSHDMSHNVLLIIKWFIKLNDSFSEKLFQFMLAKPVSKWEMPVGNFTVWNTASAQMVPWELIPSPPPMTHSQPFSHQQAQDVTFQEPSLLIWNHLLSIQVMHFPDDLHCTIEQFLTILFSTIWIIQTTLPSRTIDFW